MITTRVINGHQYTFNMQLSNPTTQISKQVALKQRIGGLIWTRWCWACLVVIMLSETVFQALFNTSATHLCHLHLSSFSPL